MFKRPTTKGKLAILALGLALGVRGVAPAPAWAEGPLTVEPVTVPDRKAVFATVESTDTLHARARIGGTVGELVVDEGDRVEAGQQLAIVGDQKLILQMQGVDARARSLTAELNQAETDLNRAVSLRRQGVVPQQRLDEANTQVRVLKQNLEAVAKERDVLAQQVAEGAILSPGAGRVLSVKVTDGAVIMPGEVVATIASETYILRMRLPERHARFLAKGDSVTVGPRGLTQDKGQAARGKGEVIQVYPQLDAGRVIADVRVDGLGDFFVGERTLVYVATGDREALIVPADYLFNRYGLTYATLEDGSEVVVQTGPLQDDGAREVLSGLRPGDVIVPPGSVRPAATTAEAGEGQ